MKKELIEYIREIRKVAGSQVGVHFGEKSPHHIREILRICEAAEKSVATVEHPDSPTVRSPKDRKR